MIFFIFFVQSNFYKVEDLKLSYNKKFCFVKQLDETDCGAACIATVSKYYGKSLSFAKIRELADTDSLGTSVKGMQKAAKCLNMTCKVLISKEKTLKDDYNYPLICHTIINGLNHYVVVLKTKRDMVLVANPAEKISWVKKDQFLQWWTGVFLSLAPTIEFEKNSEDKSFLARFLYLLKGSRSVVTLVIISSLFLTLLGILGAFYFRFLIDDVLYSHMKTTLVAISLGYLVAIIFQNILGYSRNHLVMFLGNKIEAKLLLNFFRHIMRLPLDYFVKRKDGEILSRLSDINSIKNALSAMTVGVILDSIMFIFGGIVLFAFSPKLVFVAMIPVILSGITVLLSSSTYKRLIYNRAAVEADKYSHFVESISGISTIKALSVENDSYGKAELKIIDSIQKGFSLNNFGNAIATVESFLSQIGNLVVYFYGSILIMRGDMSLGELISFVTLLGFFLGPLSRLITLQPQIQELSVAGKRLGEIFDSKEESAEKDFSFHLDKKHDFKKISVKNLSFAFGSRGNTLQDINLEINAGQKVAFVGSSGSGKTTLMKLLLKFYSPDKGKILLDDKNITDYNTSDYRNYFGYVPQETLLFSDTIQGNIALGNYDASPEEIKKAAEDADALGFIERLDEGFSTKVGEKGASLSGGERQRLSLARVLLRKPKILILDEATSSLDSLSEASIMNTIDNLPEGTTTIIVAHRLSTVTKCDKIFVLDEGKLVEEGTHEELLNKNGFYSRLWKSQNK